MNKVMGVFTMTGYDKRLYRSNNRMLGGVCGGIAEYLGIDPSLVRIGWVILTLAAGMGILIYLLAWIIIPPQPPAAPPVTDGQAAAPPPYTASQSSNRGMMAVAVIGAIIIMGGLLLFTRRLFHIPFEAFTLPVILMIVGFALVVIAIMRR